MIEIPPDKPMGSGPKTRVCYVCGRQYGLSSYEIHLKQCKELFIAREQQKDPRDRRPLPEDPMLKMGRTVNDESGPISPFSPASTGMSRQELDQINQMASDAYNTEALATCAYCGRTFLPEKLLIHNRSCTADSPARRAGDKIGLGNAASNALANVKPEVLSSTPQRRPGTTGGSRPRRPSLPKQEQPSPANDGNGDVTYLKVENGALVGHLGGSAGRSLRSSPAPNVSGDSSEPSPAMRQPIPRSNGISGANIFKISELQTKEEMLGYLNNKVDRMESMAMELSQSIAEIRSVIDKLNDS